MNILGFCSNADLPCFSFTILPMISVNYNKVVRKGLGRVLYPCRNQSNVIQWSLEPTLVPTSSLHWEQWKVEKTLLLC